MATNNQPTKFAPGSRNERNAIIKEQSKLRQLIKGRRDELEAAFPGILDKLDSNFPEKFRPALQQAEAWLKENPPKGGSKPKPRPTSKGKPRPTAKKVETPVDDPTPEAEEPVAEAPKASGIIIESGGPPDVLDTFRDDYVPGQTPRKPGRRPGRHRTGKPGRRHEPGNRHLPR